MKLFLRAVTNLLVLLFVLSLPLSGQQGLGWLTDPNAGISAAFLQPAAPSAIPYNWDLTLGAAGFVVRNNFVFLEGAAGLTFLRELRAAREMTFSETDFSFDLNGKKYTYDFPAGDRPIYGSAGAEIIGPSFSLQLGNFTRVGVFTRIRGLASTRRLEADLNYYPYDAVAINVDIPVRETYASAAVWGEVGFHLSRAFSVGYAGEMRFGISPKYLLGLEGATFFNPEGGSLRQLEGDSVIVTNLNAELGFTSAFRQANDGISPSGRGFGADLGVQYAWGESGNTGYRYTVGLSVLDLGTIVYDRAVQVHRFTNAGDVLIDGNDYEIEADDYTDEALRRLGQDVYDSGVSSLSGNDFTVRLPTAISAQFSIRPVEGLALTAVYRDDLPLSNRQLSQGSQLLAAAHFSRWWYGGGLTAGIHDWNKLNLGFQLRLGPLYLGTDQLFGTVLKRRELTGGGFYFGLRLHDFGGRKQGRNTGRSRNKRRGGKEVKCYEF